MIRIYAEKYIALGEDFRELEAIAEIGTPTSAGVLYEGADRVELDEMKGLVDLFLKVETDCKAMGLPVSGMIAEQINEDFTEIGQLTWNVVGPRVAELRRCFTAELKTTKCYMILPGRESFYTDDPLKFVTSETLGKFPSIEFDVTEAGKCFATERFTACVSHLVKVAEYVYVSFVRYAQLPSDVEKNWNKGLNQIHEKIRNKNAPFDKLPNNDEQYFVELEGYLRAFKTAWRNPASHIPVIFVEEQARSMFDVVKTLMNLASERLGETHATLNHAPDAKSETAE